MLHMWVRGEPRPQPRPRADVRSSGGGRAFARIYTPRDADRWREAVAARSRLSWRRDPTEEALEVYITVFMPRTKALLRPSSPSGPVMMAVRGKGDADNFAKAALDSMEGIVFVNDCQVVRLMVEKFYCARGGEVGCEIVVFPARPATFWAGFRMPGYAGEGCP